MNMALTKVELVEMICNNTGILKKDCVKIVETFIEIIKEELTKGNDVMISGFGKWSVKTKKERKGRNPKTGEAITIAARKVVTFKWSNSLKQIVQDSK
jgi:integration host factor subunit alpha